MRGSRRSLGRYIEPAMWVLVALRDRPRAVAALFDEVRSLDGPIGHGTLFGALSRLEHLALVESSPAPGGRRAYRLTSLGTAAAGSLTALEGGAS